MKAGELLTKLTTELQGEWPELDSQIILAHALGQPRTWVLAHPETSLSNQQISQVQDAVSKLQAGVPLPYIIGHWEFFGMEFEITRDVLIPRPETELLVEKAIHWLQASPERRTIADVGTGSGVIAVTIAVHVPGARILGTDISCAALKVAKRNAVKFDVSSHVDFLECNLLPPHFDPLPTERHFDLICANLPYIPTEKLHRLPIYGREPEVALDGGADGLEVYRHLFELAPDWLAPGGMILIETEAMLGPQTLSLAYDMFPDEVTLHLHQDLADHDRLLEIMLP
ncbi:MAG: peptide chain release factor N(5)-glutamine methyltransferase [Chloroflexi bacterium]|nr:peptide chain release factor N(5)-glutamine methyltransferase [Chloroflexota bacterium]